LEIERANALFIVESDWRATNPLLPPTISPNTPKQNFEIAILFKDDMEDVLEDDKPPKALNARALSFALGAYKVFTERVFIETSKRVHSVRN
jgi:hypothetical protein